MKLKHIRIVIAIFALVAAIAYLTSCTENQRARKFGGEQKIELPKGYRLVVATWKQDDLWYLTEPMPDGYIPSTKVFHENSSYGVWEGAVTFIESR